MTIDLDAFDRTIHTALKGSRSPRLGRPDEISTMVAMVALVMSADAEWINGQIISVDGGATMR